MLKPIKDNLLQTFCELKAPLKNLNRSSFLEALQTVDGKSATPVKRWLLRLKGDLIKKFPPKMRLQTLPVILKFLGTLTLNIYGGVSFLYSYKWVDWTARIGKRNSTKDVFLETFFQTFQNNSFSEHTLKKCIIEAFSI